MKKNNWRIIWVFRYRLITVSVIFGLFLGLGMVSSGFAWMKEPVIEAYNRNNLIRLHVVANSDSVVDQTVKLRIRNRILDLAEGLVLDVEDSSEAEVILQSSLERIEAVTREELSKSHKHLKVRAEFGRFLFPERQYPFGVLGAGEYKSIRVVLGEGKGRNWWCVLYPPLCLLSPDAPGFKKGMEEKPKVEYRLAVLENWVKAKGLTMDEFWKKWGKFFGLS
jgi:stage II sporulation protein R